MCYSRISDTEEYASSMQISKKNKKESDDEIISAQGISTYFSAHKSTNKALIGSEKEVGIKLKNVLQKSEMKAK